MPHTITDRYHQARDIMQGWLTNRLVMNDALYPHWIEPNNSYCESFWYIRDTKNPKRASMNGKEYRLVNAAAAKNDLAFDHRVLAKALQKVTGKQVDPNNLPLQSLKISLSPLTLRFQAADKHWLYKPEAEDLQEIIADAYLDQGLCSPDEKKTVFVRGDNLWLRDHYMDEELALTRDGTEDCSYGRLRGQVDIDGWGLQAGQWSPDSNYLLSFQLDMRGVPETPVIHYAPLDGDKAPTLTRIKYSAEKKDKMPTYRLVVINVKTGQLLAADDFPLMPLIFGQEDFGVFQGNPLAWWSSCSQYAFFVDVTPGSKIARVVKWNVKTGTTEVIVEETSNTHVMLNDGLNELPLFLSLPESDELIWYSERTGWGHLYLYDLVSGKLKHRITGAGERKERADGEESFTDKLLLTDHGNWLVRRVLRYDAHRRELLLQTSARDHSISPYYRDICSVNIDSCEINTLISGNYDYEVYEPNNLAPFFREQLCIDSRNDIQGVSPSGDYLVCTFSRVDTAPVSILIDREGNKILTLETADVSGLPDGWHWPEPVKLKAADKKTDLYGVVYRPPGFSVDQHYPVLELAMSMNSYSSLAQGSFVNDASLGLHYFWGAAYAALGFIVVAIEGRGTPKRSKKFRDYGYGDLAKSNDLGDRIAGLQQLAERYPYMDLNHVGITGTDGLTNAVFGLLDHPEFYKAAVLQGYTEADGGRGQYEIIHNDESEQSPANTIRCATDCVNSLKGKLLLILGGLNPSAMSCGLQLIEALQKANKDVDLICMPNMGNATPNYTMRRTWDYFVTHLQGVEPPLHFDYLTGANLVLQELAMDAKR